MNITVSAKTGPKDKGERVCQNPACGKSLAGRHGKTIYCNAQCRYDAHNTKIDEKTGEPRELRLGYGCKYPTERQAEILPCDRGRRHPYAGRRPEWSGYCVNPDCECACHSGS